MAIMVKSTRRGHRLFKPGLSGMAKGRVANIMRQTQSFGEVLIQPERARNCPANLGHFNTMGQADTEMIPIGGHKNLRLMSQTPERNGVDNPVSITLKFAAGAANTCAGFSILPTPAADRITGKSGSHASQLSTRSISWPASELKTMAFTPSLAKSFTKSRAALLERIGPTNRRLVCK